MTKSASEKLGIQGLGWIVRRSQQPPAILMPFYQAALGVRQLRPAAPTGNVMLWSGDIVMLELSSLVVSSDSLARKNDLSIVFRARNYDAAKAAMLKAGAVIEREDGGNARVLSVRTPDDMMISLWEAKLGSSFPPDSRADAMWRTGALSLPNTPSLPEALQDIASINLKVANPVKMAAFYHDVLGLELLGAPNAAGATLALGRTAVLALRPGGAARQILKDRNESPDVWIVRVYDHDGLVARLKRKNVIIVNQLSITGGKLTYASDPEGHMFGLQQRTLDLLPEGAKDRIEDVLARKLWAELSD
jgi:predicted enzyme related to lactoylglutathione lyase